MFQIHTIVDDQKKILLLFYFILVFQSQGRTMKRKVICTSHATKKWIYKRQLDNSDEHKIAQL